MNQKINKTKHTETHPQFKDLDWYIPGSDTPLVWRIKDTVYFVCPEDVLKFFSIPLKELIKEKGHSFKGVTTLSFIDTSYVAFDPHDPLYGFGTFIVANPEQYIFFNGMITCLRSKERITYNYNRKYRGTAIRIIGNKYTKNNDGGRENFLQELEEGKELCFSTLNSSEYFFPIGKCTIVVAMVNYVPWFKSDCGSVLKRDGKRIPTRPEPCGCDELFVSKEDILKYQIIEVECSDDHPFHGYSSNDQNDTVFQAVSSLVW